MDIQMSKSRVCVLMSTYNGGEYLGEQIDSILHQEDVEVKLLIRDDGSMDNTCAVIEKYCIEFQDKVKKVDIYSGHWGYSRSFLYLLQYAWRNYSEWFSYVAFSDQDDVWLPQKLKRGADALKDPTNPLIYFSPKINVDRDLKIAFEEEAYMYQGFWDFYRQSNCSGCTAVFTKKYCELLNSSDLCSVSTVYHDAFIMRVALCLDVEIIYDNKAYILYRQHGKNTIGTLKKETILKIAKKVDLLFKPRKHVYNNILSEIVKHYYDLIPEINKTKIRKCLNYDRRIFDKLYFLIEYNKFSNGSLREKIIFSSRIVFNFI